MNSVSFLNEKQSHLEITNEKTCEAIFNTKPIHIIEIKCQQSPHNLLCRLHTNIEYSNSFEGISFDFFQSLRSMSTPKKHFHPEYTKNVSGNIISEFIVAIKS